MRGKIGSGDSAGLQIQSGAIIVSGGFDSHLPSPTLYSCEFTEVPKLLSINWMSLKFSPRAVENLKQLSTVCKW